MFKNKIVTFLKLVFLGLLVSNLNCSNSSGEDLISGLTNTIKINLLNEGCSVEQASFIVEGGRKKALGTDSINTRGVKSKSTISLSSLDQIAPVIIQGAMESIPQTDLGDDLKNSVAGVLASSIIEFLEGRTDLVGAEGVSGFVKNILATSVGYLDDSGFESLNSILAINEIVSKSTVSLKEIGLGENEQIALLQEITAGATESLKDLSFSSREISIALKVISESSVRSLNESGLTNSNIPLAVGYISSGSIRSLSSLRTVELEENQGGAETKSNLSREEIDEELIASISDDDLVENIGHISEGVIISLNDLNLSSYDEVNLALKSVCELSIEALREVGFDNNYIATSSGRLISSLIKALDFLDLADDSLEQSMATIEQIKIGASAGINKLSLDDDGLVLIFKAISEETITALGQTNMTEDQIAATVGEITSSIIEAIKDNVSTEGATDKILIIVSEVSASATSSLDEVLLNPSKIVESLINLNINSMLTTINFLEDSGQASTANKLSALNSTLMSSVSSLKNIAGLSEDQICGSVGQLISAVNDVFDELNIADSDYISFLKEASKSSVVSLASNGISANKVSQSSLYIANKIYTALDDNTNEVDKDYVLSNAIIPGIIEGINFIDTDNLVWNWTSQIKDETIAAVNDMNSSNLVINDNSNINSLDGHVSEGTINNNNVSASNVNYYYYYYDNAVECVDQNGKGCNFSNVDDSTSSSSSEITEEEEQSAEEENSGQSQNNVVSFQGNWTSKTAMPTARENATASLVDNVIYVFGGSKFGELRKNEAYDIASDTWSTKAIMPSIRSHMTSAVVNDIIYVIGGYRYGYLKTVEAYNPATNSWETKATMPSARSSCSSAVVDGKIYVIGGINFWQGNHLDTVEVYDPATNSWETKKSMPTDRKRCAVSVVDDIIYVIGGYDGSYLRTVEAYNPATNSWSTKTSMPTARFDCTSVVVDGKIYVIGGYSRKKGYMNKVEIYNPANDSWTTANKISSSRSSHVSVVNDNKIYVIGGYNSRDDYLNSVEVGE